MSHVEGVEGVEASVEGVEVEVTRWAGSAASTGPETIPITSKVHVLICFLGDFTS